MRHAAARGSRPEDMVSSLHSMADPTGANLPVGWSGNHPQREAAHAPGRRPRWSLLRRARATRRACHRNSKIGAIFPPDTMATKKHTVVGVEVLRQNSIDVDELVKTLIYNASVEFVAYYYFTNLRAFCTGMDGEGIKGVIEDARLEDLSHFESCIDRIYQLGGEFPRDIADFCKQAGADFLQSDKKTTLKQILERCLKAEQGAIVNWNKVCQMTHGKDPMTYELASHILAEEIEHESWFLELLDGRPSGHMRRRYSGERPHTSKHSRSMDSL